MADCLGGDLDGDLVRLLGDLLRRLGDRDRRLGDRDLLRGDRDRFFGDRLLDLRLLGLFEPELLDFLCDSSYCLISS